MKALHHGKKIINLTIKISSMQHLLAHPQNILHVNCCKIPLWLIYLFVFEKVHQMRIWHLLLLVCCTCIPPDEVKIPQMEMCMAEQKQTTPTLNANDHVINPRVSHNCFPLPNSMQCLREVCSCIISQTHFSVEQCIFIYFMYFYQSLI